MAVYAFVHSKDIGGFDASNRFERIATIRFRCPPILSEGWVLSHLFIRTYRLSDNCRRLWGYGDDSRAAQLDLGFDRGVEREYS